MHHYIDITSVRETNDLSSNSQAQAGIHRFDSPCIRLTSDGKSAVPHSQCFLSSLTGCQAKAACESLHSCVMDL